MSLLESVDTVHIALLLVCNDRTTSWLLLFKIWIYTEVEPAKWVYTVTGL